MSRLGGAGALAPLASDLPTEVCLGRFIFQKLFQGDLEVLTDFIEAIFACKSLNSVSAGWLLKLVTGRRC